MSLSHAIRALIEELNNPRPPGQKVRGVTRHASSSPKVIRHGAKSVERQAVPLVHDRGWKHSGKTWTGHYVTQRGTYEGRIEKRGDVYQPQVRFPPEEVQKHPKFACFHKKKNGWWAIHLRRNPTGSDTAAVSDVIAYIEQILAQSLKQAGRK